MTRPLTFAVPKGRILDEALPLMARGGVVPEPGFHDKGNRALSFACEDPDMRLIRVRAFDVATFVAHGAAQAGIVGSDVVEEFAYSDLYAPVDLAIGHCRLSVAEEIRSGGAASLGWGAANWTLPGDTPVRVVITVDLRGRTISSAAAPLGTPLPTPTSAPLRADASVATGIRAIELGSAPGIENSAVGSVWIDDLVID